MLLRAVGLFFAITFIILFTGVKASARDCSNGCLTLCNKLRSTVYIAVATMDGPLSCPFSRKKCHVNVQGWWKLKPGQCYKPERGYWAETYYSIEAVSSDGKRKFPSWKQNQALLRGDRQSGMSGYSGYSICVQSKPFKQRIKGKLKVAFRKDCPKGYRKSPLNLYTRKPTDRNATFSIR